MLHSVGSNACTQTRSAGKGRVQHLHFKLTWSIQMLHGKSQVKAMILCLYRLAQVNATVQCDAHLVFPSLNVASLSFQISRAIHKLFLLFQTKFHPNNMCCLDINSIIHISHPRHQNISRLWQSFHLAGFSQLSLTINAVSSLPKNSGTSTPKISRTNRYHDRINSPEQQLVPKMFIHICILWSSHLCHRLCLC